jgi:hypothetical protein
MAARFDATRAAALGQRSGDGTPIMVTMPTDRPWVPLRILGLGAKPDTTIQADVFLLTDRTPNMLPVPTGAIGNGPAAPGLRQERSEPASGFLLDQLGSDRGMGWVPRSGMWLTFLTLDARAGQLTYDLALNVDGGAPSRVDAGIAPSFGQRTGPPAMVWAVAAAVALFMVMVALAVRQGRAGAGSPA